MNQELEIEFKNLLTKSEYDRLYEAFDFKSVAPFTQVNYYFDTSDFKIRDSESALRIRIKEDQAEMTLKTPQDSHLLETNIPLPLHQAKEFIETGQFRPHSSIINQLEKEGTKIDRVKLITSLKTERLEKPYKNTLLVLDKSWYGSKIDYELELEAEEDRYGKQIFQKILSDYHIDCRKSPNKIQRAYSHLNDIV